MKQRNRMVSVTLRSGVILSTILLLTGLVETMAYPDRLRRDLPSLDTLLPLILRGDPVATINTGLLVLMLTPLARVIVVTIEFVRDREYSFAMISIGVLLLLTMSVIIATR